MTIRQFPLNLSSAPQELVVPGSPNAIHEAVIAFGSQPSAGLVTIEYSLLGDPDFITLFHADEKDITSGWLSVRIDGPLDRIRVTFSGVVGGSGATLWLNTQGYPVEVYSGVRGAMVVQPYTEVNAKHGLQFFARAAWPLGSAIASGAAVKIHIVTGSKVLILKARELTYVAEELVLRLFANPVNVSGGDDIDIKNYNLRNPQPTTIVTAKKNVITGNDGVELEPDDPEYFFGAGASGNRVQSISPPGIERIIPPNSSLLVTIQNTGTGVARVQYFSTWYEGEPDLPL